MPKLEAFTMVYKENLRTDTIQGIINHIRICFNVEGTKCVKVSFESIISVEEMQAIKEGKR